MISGKVTVIVSISVFAAWLVAILSVAKADWVNNQRIGRRFLIVFCAAGIMAYTANRYVRWCLINYANNQPKTNNQTTTVSPEKKNTDELAYQRFKGLFEGEILRLEAVKPKDAKRTQALIPGH